MHQEAIISSQKYILLHDLDGYVVVDTGSPLSYHTSGQLSFGGTNHTCPTSIMSVDATALSQEIGLPIVGLLGMDIMSGYDNIVFDYSKTQLIVDAALTDTPPFTPLPSGSVMGVSYVDIQIEERKARVFVDTGAPISYISDSYTTGLPMRERLHDYNPAIGEFWTDTYEVGVEIGPHTDRMLFGHLPALIQMALKLVDVDGIIGYEMFSRYKVMYQHGEWSIS